MKSGKRAALYARVSTSHLGQDPEAQIRELRQYCRIRGWAICGEYIDRGISGGKESRPELDRLMADAHRRRCDVVCVFKFDRYARSVPHLLRSLEVFESLGVSFVSVSEQIDTGTPTGKMVLTILGAVAALERAQIADRVRSGLRNARAKGTKLGRPPLNVLGASEIAALRRSRKSGMSFKRLAQTHKVSVWTAFQLCKGPIRNL